MRACEDCGFRPALEGGRLCSECAPAAPKGVGGESVKPAQGTVASVIQVSELDRFRGFGSAIWWVFVFSCLGAVFSVIGFDAAERENPVGWLLLVALFSLIANATLLAGIFSAVMYRHSRVLLEGLGRLSPNRTEYTPNG